MDRDWSKQQYDLRWMRDEIIKKLVNDEGYSIKGVKKYLSKKKISNIKKEGAIQISEELDIKLDNIEKYLKKAKSVLINE